MTTARVLACCLLILPLVGTPPRVLRNRPESLFQKQTVPSAGAPFALQLRTATALFATARYADAALAFQRIEKMAVQAGDRCVAAVAAGNAGGCQFALHQYRSALDSFLRGRQLAQSAGDSSKSAALEANIASLYSELGEVDSAARWTESSLQHISGEERRRHLPKLLIQMGVLRAQQGRTGEAARLFQEGIAAADAAGDLNTYALGYNRMGEAFLLRDDLAHAEPPLVEAFRIRKLHHLALDTSYHRLGRLRLAQGDLAAASNLLDRAVELAAASRNSMPAWDIYYSRGCVRLAQARLTEALDDLRASIRMGRAWWRSAPGAQSALIGAETRLDQVYSTLIEAAASRYERTGDPALVREAFAAAEENHAASLRTIVSRRSAAVLPAGWSAAGSALEDAEAAAFRHSSPDAIEALRSARARLAFMEASEAEPAPMTGASATLSQRVQAALPSDAALFSFHLGSPHSWLWAVDRSGISLYRLPSRPEIQLQVRRLTGPPETPGSGGADAASQLFTALFGGVSPRLIHQPRWILSLDQDLFNVPFSILKERSASTAAYVAERHVIQIVPSASLWVDSSHAPRLSSRLFLGIGDPIYNAADRRDASAPISSSPLSLFATVRGPADGSLALARLVGSGLELAAGAHAWQARQVLLEGGQATRASLLEQLRRNPAIIHFATHFVPSAEQSLYAVPHAGEVRTQTAPESLIALSINSKQQLDLLSSPEIAHWRVGAELVTLSGCHSGAGAMLPGSGLLGLTRSWLAAGARSVLGTLWDTPDDSGAIFTSFYRNLSLQHPPDAALALSLAQREMIRSGGWRAQPRYWGAYFVVAND